VPEERRKRAYVPITTWLDQQLSQIAREMGKGYDDLTNEVLTNFVRDYFYKDEKPDTGK